MTQNADEHRNRAGCLAVGVAIFVVALPLTYVLSVGPAVLLVERGLLPMQPLDMFYTPLQWLHDNNDIARRILDTYVELWR